MNKQTYVTDLSQLCGADKFIYAEGKAKGMTFIRMYNGVLNLMVSADRALDIYNTEFEGKNIVFMSKNGVVNPKLSSSAIGFINDFGGGLLYTCGLDNIGTPREGYIQHGSISYLPATNINITNGYDKDDYFVKVTGDIKYTSLFGHHLILRRSIKLLNNKPQIFIEDEIDNQNQQDDQYMLMYHMNFGYPFINEQTKIVCDQITETEVFNEDVSRIYGDYHHLEEPKVKQPEDVFIHTLKQGTIHVDIINPDDTVNIQFNSQRLKFITQWKSMASGDYALGIEPATTKMSDRNYTSIKAFDKHVYKLELTFKNKENTHE